VFVSFIETSNWWKVRSDRGSWKHFVLKGRFVLFFAAIISCVVLWFGAEGVRGTDQYWYAADVETLVEQKPPITNIVYPGKLLREAGGTSTPNYIMHNGPFIALASIVSKFYSPYTSWMLLNFFSHILVAAAVFFVCRLYTGAEIASWVGALYLVSPIAIWQSLNMLQEQLYAGCLAVCLAAFAFHDRWQSQVILVGALAIGTMSHPIFFLLALVYLFYLLVHMVRNPDIYRVLSAVITVLVIYLAQHYKGLIFPSAFQPDLRSIIASAVPGGSNMLWHQSDTLPPITMSLFLDKFIYAFNAHFLQLRNWPLYLYTNIALAASLYLFLFRLRVYKELLIALCVCLGAYIGILILMQTQVRYQQIVAAATFVALGLAAYEIRNLIKPWQAKSMGILLLCFNIGIASIMALKVRKEARAESFDLSILEKAFTEYPAGSRFLFVDLELEAVDLFAPDYIVLDDSHGNALVPPSTTGKEISTGTMGNFYVFPFY